MLTPGTFQTSSARLLQANLLALGLVLQTRRPWHTKHSALARQDNNPRSLDESWALSLFPTVFSLCDGIYIPPQRYFGDSGIAPARPIGRLVESGMMDDGSRFARATAQ